jgi:hypothetical protein
MPVGGPCRKARGKEEVKEGAKEGAKVGSKRKHEACAKTGSEGAQTVHPEEAKGGSSSLHDALRTALECPICIETMLPPILQCPSGHSICKTCSSKVRKCPTCRASLSNIRNLSLEQLAVDQGIEFPCAYASNGCKSVVRYSELSVHLNTCPQRPLMCPHAEGCFCELCKWRQTRAAGQSQLMRGCKWTGSEDQLHEHLLKDHGASFALLLPCPSRATFHSLPIRTNCQPLPPHSSPRPSMYVVSTQAKDKGKDAKHDGTLGAKPNKDDAHDKMTYCIDTTIYGEALTKTHVRYFQVLPPGAHSPIAFSLEFVWHGPGNLMHTARASERLNSRVVAFVVLRCMGKEHTDWFYSIRVGRPEVPSDSAGGSSSSASSTRTAGGEAGDKAPKAPRVAASSVRVVEMTAGFGVVDKDFCGSGKLESLGIRDYHAVFVHSGKTGHGKRRMRLRLRERRGNRWRRGL